MARNKGTMSYLNKKTMTDSDYKKAIAALNMRLRRVGSSEFADFSASLSEINKFKSVLTAKNYKGQFNSAMITKSGHLSSSLKNFSAKEKKAAKEWVKSLLSREDLTVPFVKKKVETRAHELNTSVEKYLKDKEFWKMFREIKEETEYGSSETFNAIDIADGNSGTYEERKAIAQRALDEYNQWEEDEDLEAEDLDEIGSLSGEEIIDMMTKAMTKSRVDKRSVRK